MVAAIVEMGAEVFCEVLGGGSTAGGWSRLAAALIAVRWNSRVLGVAPPAA